MAKNIIERTDCILPNAFKFASPCIILHGQGDMVTNNFDSIEFFNKFSRLVLEKMLIFLCIIFFHNLKL